MIKTPTHIRVLRRRKDGRVFKMKKETVFERMSTSARSHNSGYAVRAEYRHLPNCPALRFGQLRIAAKRYASLFCA